MSRLGIIAGGGELPRKLIEACQRDDRSFFVLAIRGQANKKNLKNVPHSWCRIGAIGEAINIFKSENVDTLVMAGSVKRPGLPEMKPDWRTIQVFARLGMAAFGDDSLLRAVVAELEKEGFRLVGAHEIEPRLITPEGILTKKAPSPENKTDIEYGIKVVKALGRLDVGQAAVVQQGIVLGVEAAEGTDALLERCVGLRRKGRGGVLVKTCKPQQDTRIDLPTIGLRTIRYAWEAGLEGIAVEAGASLLLDRDEAISAANKLGFFIEGFKAP
ncbi:MAG: UDP-2,3-diacylglucosamine diphosphatase LpxI [Alphaproteobacteria bacterium]|nr:UDP-2,3-diacylglucosamine diphosphatase LpxI [Alphaproteobacteria bacterium]MCK5659040.1 UDP-2,3-diacylglucosamine diphosphatase LpxI [Alphaproteobacteria bacterium]